MCARAVIERIWPGICDMFSPWLFPYYPQNLPNLPANWIRQFNTPILLPWSELYSHYSQMMLHSFISCIQFMLDTFPACDLILSNIFYWYESNFGNVAVPRHVLLPTNASLVLLPWHRFKPNPLNIGGFHRLLQQVIMEIEKKTTLISFNQNHKTHCLSFCNSIFQIVIRFSVTYFYVSVGRLGCITISISGNIHLDAEYCPHYC